MFLARGKSLLRYRALRPSQHAGGCNAVHGCQCLEAAEQVGRGTEEVTIRVPPGSAMAAVCADDRVICRCRRYRAESGR